MAEIHIQKKRPPVWPWILLILVLIVAAWLFIETTRDDDLEVAGGVRDESNYDEFNRENLTAPDTSYAAVMVNEYIAFINEEQQNRSEEEFISEGIKKLGMALSAIAREKFPGDAEINREVDSIQKKTGTLDNVSENSNDINDIAAGTVQVMNSMQQKGNENIEGEVSKVKESADKISSDRPAVKQQKEITSFLRESGDVLQILAADDKDDNINNRY
jgi:hypothetical protein